MFDIYSINESPRHTSVIVTEKRAPTDESVRLLREMEEAVQKRMLAAIRVESTEFKCVVQVHENHMTDDRILMAIFSVNGQKMTAQYTMSHTDDVDTAVTGLRNAVAEKIANHIASAFNKDFMMRLR
jgi:hypothetical protein